MRLNKRKLFEDLHHSGVKPGDNDYRDKAEEFVKRFFVVNDATVSKKTLDEIASEVVKFVVRVRQFWNSRSVNRHVAQKNIIHTLITSNDIPHFHVHNIKICMNY